MIVEQLTNNFFRTRYTCDYDDPGVYILLKDATQEDIDIMEFFKSLGQEIIIESELSFSPYLF